jgi:hypothetical protein
MVDDNLHWMIPKIRISRFFHVFFTVSRHGLELFSKNFSKHLKSKNFFNTLDHSFGLGAGDLPGAWRTLAEGVRRCPPPEAA